MELNELRIGNFTCSEDESNKFIVEKIIAFNKLSGVYVNSEISNFKQEEEDLESYTYVSINAVKPVKITENWLLNLGFEKEGNGFKNDVLQIKDYYGSSWRVAYGCGKSVRIFNRKIKYVHELQNLYFVLTGSDLKPVFKVYDIKHV